MPGLCEIQTLGASPLKFDYGKQMPLLKILRDEVSSLKKEIDDLRRQAAVRELIVTEESSASTAYFEAERQERLKQKETIVALKKQLGSVAKQWEAAQEAAATAKEAVEAVRRAACERRSRRPRRSAKGGSVRCTSFLTRSRCSSHMKVR